MQRAIHMARKIMEKTVKNRLLTERKLIDAVGTIIRTEGYKGLGVNAIAKAAKVNKKLIYRYFENVDRLIETYVIEKDYWLSFNNKITSQLEVKNLKKKDNMLKMLSALLEKQFEFFYNEDEMQKIILWEISEHTPLLEGVCKGREEYGETVLSIAEQHFKDSDVNIRGVGALLVSGIYYLVLHAKTNNSTICGLDVNSEAGREEISKSIRQVLEWTFKAGKTKKSKKKDKEKDKVLS